jgi:DNA-binding PadR family transcriptional regulator
MLLATMGLDRRPSKQMLILLDALAGRAHQWRHGYELLKETGLLSGTLYPLLMRMTDQGLVEAEWREPTQPGRPARHAYRLTASGLALARAVSDNQVPIGRKVLGA